MWKSTAVTKITVSLIHTQDVNCDNRKEFCWVNNSTNFSYFMQVQIRLLEYFIDISNLYIFIYAKVLNNRHEALFYSFSVEKLPKPNLFIHETRLKLIVRKMCQFYSSYIDRKRSKE